MEALFLRVLNMSLAGGLVIAVLLPLRALLRRAPKKWSYLLWAVAGFRLACPVSVSAAFSLFRLARVPTETPRLSGQAGALQALPRTVTAASMPELYAADMGRMAAGQSLAPAAPPEAVLSAPNPARVWLTAGAVLWLLGLAALLLWGVLGYLRTLRRLRGAVRLGDQLYESGAVRSPFILGILRPRIYLPPGLEGETLTFVLAHERCHLRRGDPGLRLLAFLLLAVHWFNPLVWLAYRLMGRDMEMSCDERVLRELGGGAKAYSRSLLSFAVDRSPDAPAPLAFCESDVKRRILNVLNWKKPSLWATLGAAALCIAAAAACATNPVETAAPEGSPADPAPSPVQAVQNEAPPERAGDGRSYSDAEEYVAGAMSRAETEVRETTGSLVKDASYLLRLTGEMSGLSPEGSLETYRYSVRLLLEDRPADGDGNPPEGTESGENWYESGEYDLILLRRADGSCEVIYDSPVNDGMGFFGYHETFEEALWDWYVTGYGLDYPLYVQDWGPQLPELEGNYPVRRYDGDGWYLYIPLAAWEKVDDDAHWQWVSQYGTGSSLTVRRATAEEAAAERPRLTEGQSLRYVPAADGGFWCVFTVYQPENLSDYPMISVEPEVLALMAESFTVTTPPSPPYPQ